jgi:riboflavin-specific deaminase-like protein
MWQARIDREAMAEDVALDEGKAWQLLRALAHRAAAGDPVTRVCGVSLDGQGRLEEVDLGLGWLDVYPDGVPVYRSTTSLVPDVEAMLDLYLPLCIGAQSSDLVVAHIGQSLDGQIATSTGASCFITGPQDLAHTHRLRALFDAVLVGRATIECDNPRLTTRLVSGASPTRVVVDPSLRSPIERKVFGDATARTLLLCAQGKRGEHRNHGHAEIVEVSASGPLLHPAAILDALRQRGLRRIFVEGGGVTVSHFLQARVLDRVHVTISPLFLGQGRPGLALAKIDGLDEALRPRVRRFDFGEDMLFDCRFQR